MIREFRDGFTTKDNLCAKKPIGRGRRNNSDCGAGAFGGIDLNRSNRVFRVFDER